MKTRPWTMLLAMMTGWLNRHQQDMIEYLKTENVILKEKIGKKRIILNDDQRRKLAILGKNIGQKGLNCLTSAKLAQFETFG
jgi:putative transposase